MRVECLGCTNGLDHCHGTLVHHVSGVVECLDEVCGDLDATRHEWIIDCQKELIGGCDCAGVVASLRPASFGI